MHGNVAMHAVFADGAGEWKLAGVEFMASFSDTSVRKKTLEGLRCYDPPEATRPAGARRVEKW